MSNYSNHHNYQDEEIKKDLNSLVTMLGLSLVGALGYIAVQDFIKKYKNSGNLDDKIKEVKPSYPKSDTNNQTKSRTKVESKRDFQSSVSDVCDKLQKDCAKLKDIQEKDTKAKSKFDVPFYNPDDKDKYKKVYLEFFKEQQSVLLDVLNAWKNLSSHFNLSGSKLRYACSNMKPIIVVIYKLAGSYLYERIRNKAIDRLDQNIISSKFKKLYKLVKANSK